MGREIAKAKSKNKVRMRMWEMTHIKFACYPVIGQNHTKYTNKQTNKSHKVIVKQPIMNLVRSGTLRENLPSQHHDVGKHLNSHPKSTPKGNLFRKTSTEHLKNSKFKIQNRLPACLPASSAID